MTAISRINDVFATIQIIVEVALIFRYLSFRRHSKTQRRTKSQGCYCKKTFDRYLQRTIKSKTISHFKFSSYVMLALRIITLYLLIAILAYENYFFKCNCRIMLCCCFSAKSTLGRTIGAIILFLAGSIVRIRLCRGISAFFTGFGRTARGERC